MLYLVDANVLITAKNQYYEFDRVPEYWGWFVSQAEQNRAKIPSEIYEEIARGNDNLATWARRNRDAIVFQELVDADHRDRVINEGYGDDLNQNQIETMGHDPDLIAYALANKQNRTVVTLEVPSRRQRHNRKIPDVCDHFDIEWCDPWKFGRELDFRTTWNR